MSLKNIAYINPEMLKWGRLGLPFGDNIEMVSQRVNIKTEDIIKWENGEELPSITEAKKLANFYDVTFAALYLDNLPNTDKNIYVDRRTMTGSGISDISYELWKEIRYLISCRENAVEMIESIDDVKSLPYFNLTDSIYDIAKKIREFFDISTPFRIKKEYNNNPFQYFRNKLEQNGILVMQMTGISIEEIKGISLSYDKLPIIAINSNDFSNSKTFTLFHELAHLIRRSSSLCMVDFDQYNDAEEKICDSIAAEILLPTQEFKELVKTENSITESEYSSWLTKIANKFGISKLVVVRKLYELKIIDTNKYHQKYQECTNEFMKLRNILLQKRKEKKSFGLKKQVTYVSENGKLYPNIILSAYSNGKISLGETSRMLNVHVKHLEPIGKAVMLA